MTTTLQSGQAAMDRRAWDEAWETLAGADRDGTLSPMELELMAEAGWWAGHAEESVDVLERAFAGYVEEGMPVAAANIATLLSYLALRRLAVAVARGWHAQAVTLLEGQPESKVHAFVKVLETVEAFRGVGDLTLALARAEEAVEIARRTGNRDAESAALGFKGAILVTIGEWQEGLTLLDQATAAALAGGLALRTAADVYCTMISACRTLADFGRAAEWTEEADRWMGSNQLGGYPGVCRVHRAELKRLHGDWSGAEEEAADACAELERFRILDGVGLAYYEIGEVRLHLGDFKGAEQAFASAYENGRDPQPGYALLQLERGDADGAAQSLARSLAALSGDGAVKTDVLSRALLLPAQVEVGLARSDLETARAATAELEMIAAEFGRPAFRAAAMEARGRLLLAEGNPSAAAQALGQAWRIWREIDFPYESARARIQLAMALAADGDPGASGMELAAARSVLERLGAVPDLKLVDDLLFRQRPVGERDRATRALMFTDIVTSTDLIGVIGDEAWEGLLGWHDRALREVFTGFGGEEANHTGDGFFVVFDDVDNAIEAAVGIQRRLSEHRQLSGFAPTVRIGIHTAEITKDGTDYRGQGVHTASRVASVAAGEEIVVSADAAAEAGELRYQVSEPRTVELKGIKDPVQVHTVDWR